MKGVAPTSRLHQLQHRQHHPSAPLRNTLRAHPLRVRAASSDGNNSGTKQRKPWDVGRFLQTVLFFNPPPKPVEVIEAVASQPFKLLQAAFSGNVETRKSALLTVVSPQLASEPTAAPTAAAATVGDKVVMVTGADGEVGRQVVQQLLAQGQQVRAVVADLAAGQEALGALPVGAGGALQLAAEAGAAAEEVVQGVRRLVVCGAPAGDSAAQQRLRHIVAAAAERLSAKAGHPLLSATVASDRWGALDDVVMGGISQSAVGVWVGAGEGGAAAVVFSGVVSTDNSGGFTSVRCRNYDPLLDLSAYDGLQLRLRGDGQRYKMILRTDTNWDGIAYCRSFTTAPDGAWQTLQLPFSSFAPVFRAKTLADAAPPNTATVASIQLMLSKFEYDGQLNPSFRAGAFELPIAEISAYLADPGTPCAVCVPGGGSCGEAAGVLAARGVGCEVVDGEGAAGRVAELLRG